MKQFLESLVICAVAVVIVAVGVWIGSPKFAQHFGDTTIGYVAKTATNSSVGAPGGATTTAISAKSGMTYADICNDNPSNTKFYLSLGIPAATSTGILLAGGNCYEIRDVNMFVGGIGMVNASSSAATATLVTIP